VPRPAVAIALPRPEFDAVRAHLTEAGYEAFPVGSASDLERVLRSRPDVALAVLDVENDFDGALEMYALLHEGGHDIPALLLMPPKSFGRIGLGSSQVRDEYFQRPYSAESLRWRVEAMLIRVDASPSGKESEQADASSATGSSADAAAAATDLVGSTEQEGAALDATEDPGKGRVVIVFNPKGGVGKTTISINLGAVLQIRKSQRVLLVDCDTITGHIASSLGMERLRTLSQVWTEQAKGGPAQDIPEIASVHSSGVSVLVLSSSPLHTEILEPIRVASAVADARRAYDWIILDMHPDYGPLNQNLFALADRILVPVTPDVPCIRAAVQFREVADDLGIRDRMSIVINRAKSGVSAADVERVVQIPPLARVRSAGMLFVKAADQGRSAVEVSPQAKVVADLDYLGQQLMSAVDGDGPVAPSRRWLPLGVRNLLGRFTSQA
jgi:MinD-like ATPase involved in chromosome partitioning or flagellar assembly